MSFEILKHYILKQSPTKSINFAQLKKQAHLKMTIFFIHPFLLIWTFFALASASCSFLSSLTSMAASANS